MPKPTDEKLMRLVMKDDPSAMTELVKRYQSKLFQFFYRMSGDQFLAEDLVQESFIRLYKYRSNFNESKRLQTWLFQIARNTWNTSFRKQEKLLKNKNLESIPKPVESAFNAIDRFDTQQLIKTALLQLSERDRQLVILHHLKGFSYKELSKLFEISEGTLRVILCRALKKLGIILKNIGYEHN